MKGELVSLKDWEAEKQRYEPQLFDPGVTVYVVKSGMPGPQHGQHFCPACYQNRKTSILQAMDETRSRRQLRRCLECKAELAYGPQAPMPQVRSVSDGGWT